jgi:hypothetical protein
MIPQALFVPHRPGDYEVSHCGVVLRVRDGKPEHIGGQSVSHVERLDAKGKRLGVYDEKREDLPKQGHIQSDFKREGYWLVPAKHVDEFAGVWFAEQERLKAQAEAAAQKDG